MLTPAEELGLRGLSLAARLRTAFYQMPKAEIAALIRNIHDESKRRHLIYLRDAEPDTIRVMPSPLTALRDQLSYIRFVALTIQNALKRLPDLYLEDAVIRDLLRLPPEEEKWITDCWGENQRENNPVFGRYDAMVDLVSPMWKDSLRFVEPNMSGIGGLQLVPTAERLLTELLLPALAMYDANLHLETGQDIRDLLVQEVLDHLDAIGRPAQNICFVDPKYDVWGPDEQEALAEYVRERYGLKVMHADPSELSLRHDEVYYEGQAVDLVYRDYSIADLVELEKHGVDVTPMRTLFQQNRVVSSIAGDLDQKSCWEILTDSQISQKYFSAEERQVFRRHILWTRILSDRTTQLPDGQIGSLLDYVRREHESLVLKPNRSYGGKGVVIGHGMPQSDWETAMQEALGDNERWVVQQLASIPVSDFAVLGPDGAVQVEPYYTVMGFAPSKYGLATLGRASQKQVINVAQRGGLCVLMTGHPERVKPSDPGHQAQ